MRAPETMGEKVMRIAICPGSYDPVTLGHLNIIRRSMEIFDKVIVTVLVNPLKKTAFSTDERVHMLRLAMADLPGVEVDSHDGLVAEYARQKGACALVKGLRAVTDFENEFQMALINKKVNPELETVFFITDAEYMYLSSSAVREIASFGGSVSEFVPPEIEPMIISRLRKEG